MLSAPPLVDADFPCRHAKPSPIDNVTRRLDGSHLGDLWRIRQPWYPAGDIDLLERFVVDAVKAGPRAAAGHAVVARYVMETRLPLIRCPVLVIAPSCRSARLPERAAAGRAHRGQPLCRGGGRQGAAARPDARALRRTGDELPARLTRRAAGAVELRALLRA